MAIKMRYPLTVDEITGKREETLDFEGTLGDLIGVLSEKYGEPFERKAKWFSYFVNGGAGGKSDLLKDGDEVVVDEPFCGG